MKSVIVHKPSAKTYAYHLVALAHTFSHSIKNAINEVRNH
nr:MAG TPA: hypothetical protein [Bacteriophage sp.]